MQNTVLYAAIEDCLPVKCIKEGKVFIIQPLYLIGDTLAYTISGTRYELDITDKSYEFEEM